MTTRPCGPPGWDGPHGQARLGAGSGQNRPALMPASVTRETWKVCTDDGTFPSAGISALIGIPVLALIVSTSLLEPPNTSGPAVRVSADWPPAIEFATVTAEMVDSRRRTPSLTCGSPPPALSASTLLFHR